MAGPVDPPREDRSVTVDLAPSPTSETTLAAAQQLATLLAPAWDSRRDDPPVHVVDIGANPLDDRAPYQLLLDAGLCRVVGFEPQTDALELLRQQAGPQERYLPYLVGDGEPALLRLCATAGFAGLREPDPGQLQLLTDFPDLAAVHTRTPVTTRRLDDITEIERMDLLKIDIQGGELDVLQHARRTLAHTVAVQTEVGFHRLYRDQPTFAEVDLELRAHGLVPHRFVTTRTWPMAPVPWADPLEEHARQLVEADLLYLRDPARPEELTDAQLARIALIADVAYSSVGPALRAVLTLIERGVLPATAEQEYRQAARARLLNRE